MGRKSRSGMGNRTSSGVRPQESAGGGGSAMDQFRQASAERQRLASARAPMDQIQQARQRETNAAYNVVSDMSDSQIQSAADRYIDHVVNNPTESNAEMKRWLNGISGTKKDGSPTDRAVKNARGETWKMINNQNGLGLSTEAYSYLDPSHSAQTDRLARALVRSASRHKGRF